MISGDRKRELMHEVATFACQILDRAATTCDCAAASSCSDEEDHFSREYLRSLVQSVRRSLLGGRA